PTSRDITRSISLIPTVSSLSSFSGPRPNVPRINSTVSMQTFAQMIARPLPAKPRLCFCSLCWGCSEFVDTPADCEEENRESTASYSLEQFHAGSGNGFHCDGSPDALGRG